MKPNADNRPPACCVIIPFLDRPDMMRENLEALLSDMPEDALAVLVDDGSSPAAADNPTLSHLVGHPNVRLLRHETTRGPAAARNTAIAWCREARCSLIVLLDSDCLVDTGFAQKHMDLHREYPDIACIGGAIRGIGNGLAAHLDGIMSWYTSVPGSPLRVITPPLHLPTTNMSLKLDRLPPGPEVFDPRLRTGEDVALVKRLREQNDQILFSPQPIVRHRDRENIAAFLRHQMRWAIHSYAVRFGYAHPKRLRRAVMLPCFFLLLPLFALYTSYLNMAPWVAKDWRYIAYWPAVLAVMSLKGLGVLAGILNPGMALYRAENAVGIGDT